MKKLLPLILLMSIFVGCKSDDKATGPTGDARTIAASGWDLFEVGEYSNALNLFNQAEAIDGGLVDAKIGIGWSETRASTHNYQRAIAKFAEILNPQTGLAKNSNDAQAGLAYAYYGNSQFNEADSAATYVVVRSSIWNFIHDQSISVQDLHALRASCRFNVGNFDSSLAAIQRIDADFFVDVNRADGRALLAQEIERWLGR